MILKFYVSTVYNSKGYKLHLQKNIKNGDRFLDKKYGRKYEKSYYALRSRIAKNKSW